MLCLFESSFDAEDRLFVVVVVVVIVVVIVVVVVVVVGVVVFVVVGVVVVVVVVFFVVVDKTIGVISASCREERKLSAANLEIELSCFSYVSISLCRWRISLNDRQVPL